MITGTKETPIDIIAISSLHMGDVFYMFCGKKEQSLCMLIDDYMHNVVQAVDLNDGSKINIYADKQVTPIRGEIAVTFRNRNNKKRNEYNRSITDKQEETTMKLEIDISEDRYEWIKKQWNIDGDIVLNDYPNGDVIRMLFPPSVYFGERGKHLVTFAKDCEMQCYNEKWWNTSFGKE